MRTTTAWDLMVQTLAGEPPPPLPPLPGRVHRAPPASDFDAYAAAWDRRTSSAVQPGWLGPRP